MTNKLVLIAGSLRYERDYLEGTHFPWSICAVGESIVIQGEFSEVERKEWRADGSLEVWVVMDDPEPPVSRESLDSELIPLGFVFHSDDESNRPFSVWDDIEAKESAE
ncbi:hypothetical protein UFOVP1004_2 [uncultured Caudovirales phage]|uniref:Uncharacterized protein n=1 Tax=uncultured Caudovirales phage TaxID=2100421 RepID=A0A6J5Q0I5_9CAUD|nr:hypothetical protein UFOVP1004_2 [uncultured Caudovirales phage]